MANPYNSLEDELKAVQEELQRTKQQTRLSLEAVGIGLWTLYPKQNRVIWDEQCQKLYDWPGDTVSMSDFIPRVHPQDLVHLQSLMLNPPSQQTGKPTTVEYRITSPTDGQLRWIRITGRATVDQSGLVECISGTAQNITEEKRIESALSLEEQRFRTAFDHASVGMIILDLQSRMQLVNRAFSDFIGYSQQDLYNVPFTQITHPDDVEKNVALAAQLLRDERPFYVFNKRYRHKNGSFIWAQISSALIRREDGTPDSFITIVQDISAEVEAQTEQQKLLSLVGTSVDYMSVVSLDGRMQYINPTGRRLIGLDAHEDVSRLWVKDFYAPQHLDRTRQEVEPTLLTTGKWSGTVELQHFKTGELIPVYMNAVILTNPATGEPLARGVTIRDLRPERAAQRSLNESEERWREAIELAELGTFEFNLTRKSVHLSSRLKDWVGLAADEEINTTELLTTTPDRALVRSSFEQAVAQGPGAIVDVEYRTRNRRTSEERWFHAQGRMVQGANEATLLRGVVKDITAERQYAQELEQQVQSRTQALQQVTAQVARQAEQLRFVTDSSLTAIALYTIVRDLATGDVVDLRYELVNQMALRMTGHQAEELIGHTMLEVFPGTAINGIWQRYRELAQTGVPLRFHNHYTHEGYNIWYEVQGIREGEQIVLSFLDITQLKKTQLQLEALNQDLLQSNDNLQQFAYVASHDLQEPLRKIQSFGNLLHDQYADSLGNGAELVQRMQLAAGRMSVLIKDILAFARINRTSEQTATPVPLDRVLARVLDDLELAIQEAGATIHTEPLPVLMGDDSQLQQLFQNLLSNALKFRRPDVPLQIQIRSQQVAAAELPSGVVMTRPTPMCHLIAISDNGIGFDEKYLDRIFQVFQRLHGRNQYAGTGIGLAIVQKVVANHGGAITALSKPGEGSTFLLYFPVSTVPAAVAS